MGVPLVEDVDCFESVDVLGVAPVADVMAHPFDEVLELPVPDLGVEQPYQVPGIEVWWRCSLLIGLVLVALLGVDHTSPGKLVDFSHT